MSPPITLDLLPNEILHHILSLLGSSFFRRHPRRLRVCKWWYQLARPILLRDLAFSAGSLRRLGFKVDAGGALPSFKEHATSLTLNIEGFEAWRARRPRRGKRKVEFAGWCDDLTRGMLALADMVKESDKLRSVKLDAGPERWRTCVEGLPMMSLLSISNLTCLELDTVGLCLVDNGQIGYPAHLCESVVVMIPTLRRLRYRHKRVCPRILDVPEGSPPLALEEVLINMSLIDQANPWASHRYASHCTVKSEHNLAQLKSDMEKKAEQLVRAMANPRLVRILSCAFPFDIDSNETFDALTGRHMALAPGKPWDADGPDVVVQTEGLSQEEIYILTDLMNVAVDSSFDTPRPPREDADTYLFAELAALDTSHHHPRPPVDGPDPLAVLSQALNH